MISRETYTKIFLTELGRSTDEANVKVTMDTIWQSRRTKIDGGLRLSDKGYEFLVGEVKLQEYEIPFTEPIDLSPQIIIFFDRYLDCPYYLTYQGLTVFSEKKAFELHLFSDDIRKFGLVKAMNERQKDLDESEENS
jgi:hypothetical protein